MRRIFELLVAKDGQAQMETQRVSWEDSEPELFRLVQGLAQELTQQGHSGEIYITRITFLGNEEERKELLDKLSTMYGTHRMGP